MGYRGKTGLITTVMILKCLKIQDFLEAAAAIGSVEE